MSAFLYQNLARKSSLQVMKEGPVGECPMYLTAPLCPVNHKERTNKSSIKKLIYKIINNKMKTLIIVLFRDFICMWKEPVYRYSAVTYIQTLRIWIPWLFAGQLFWVKKIHVCLNKWPHPLSRGDELLKICWHFYKKNLLNNHMAREADTCVEAFSGCRFKICSNHDPQDWSGATVMG